MPVLHLVLEEPAWPELDLHKIVHVTTPISVARLRAGMESGKPSVAIRIDLPDGRTVIAETSQELFVAAARGMEARSEYEMEVNGGDRSGHA